MLCVPNVRRVIFEGGNLGAGTSLQGSHALTQARYGACERVLPPTLAIVIHYFFPGFGGIAPGIPAGIAPRIGGIGIFFGLPLAFMLFLPMVAARPPDVFISASPPCDPSPSSSTRASGRFCWRWRISRAHHPVKNWPLPCPQSWQSWFSGQMAF